MFGANLEIHLLPQQAILLRSPRWQGGAAEKLSEIKAHTTRADNLDWTMEACKELLEHAPKGRASLRLFFSDLWARYHLIQLGSAALNDKDAMALARVKFSRCFPGADYALWPLRITRQGERMLLAGMNPALLTSIQHLAASTGKRLAGVEPLFTRIYDRHLHTLSEGWILFDEPGMLIAAFIEQGLLLSLHCQRISEFERDQAAPLLLERQAALIGRPASEVHLISYSGATFALREPWRIKQSLNVGFEADCSQLALSFNHK